MTLRVIRGMGMLAVVGGLLMTIACLLSRSKKHRQQQPASKPRGLPPIWPLPEVRKFTLTPPPSPSLQAARPERSPRLRSQSRSPLFAKLPVEIRTLIYEQALGLETLHIVGKKVRVWESEDEQRYQWSYLGFTHVRCTGNCEEMCQGTGGRNGIKECWGCHAHDGDRIHKRRSSGRERVGLLRACRRVYVEAIDVLYRTNTFDFHCADRLRSFQTTVLPQRFQTIRRLRLHRFFVFREMEDWRKIWMVVAEMDGLRDVEVFLNRPKGALLTSEEEMDLFEPLFMVTHVREFVVNVSWPRVSPLDMLDEMPFRVVEMPADKPRYG